jgi:hypothetical protein
MKMRSFLLYSLLGLLSFKSVGQTITQTNLPIVIITTTGTIADTQILGNLKIIDNGPSLNHPADAAKYQGNIGIKYRGSSTNPKRSYNIETWTNVQKVSLDTSLLGMPTENDWVLLAEYTDRSLMRDLIGFHIYKNMGFYAPRMKLVEVILNNNYQGIYLFGEKIKRDVNRVDIANLKITDVSGTELTGGYIFKIDNSADNYWTSAYAPPHATAGQTIKFHYEEPADNVITPVQQVYIKAYTDSFEAVLYGSNFQDTLNGWRKYASHNSFEDYLVFNEIMKNEAAYSQATYLYKDKGKKLRVGPPWDMELSLYNTMDCDASKDTGWAYMHAVSCPTDAFEPPFWWEKLAMDTAFMSEAKCKYTHDRSSFLDTVKLFAFIDSINTLVNAEQAQARNFQKWPIWGIQLVNEPLPVSANYSQEVTKVKAFIKRRFQYLDSKWLTPGCVLGIANVSSNINKVSIFPNPVVESFTMKFTLDKAGLISYAIQDLAGRIITTSTVKKLPAGEAFLHVPINAAAPGIYTVTIFNDGMKAGTYKLIKE